MHLLVQCSVAVKAWRESPWEIQLNLFPVVSTAELVSLILNADSTLNIGRDEVKAFVLNAAIVLLCWSLLDPSPGWLAED